MYKTGLISFSPYIMRISNSLLMLQCRKIKTNTHRHKSLHLTFNICQVLNKSTKAPSQHWPIASPAPGSTLPGAGWGGTGLLFFTGSALVPEIVSFREALGGGGSSTKTPLCRCRRRFLLHNSWQSCQWGRLEKDKRGNVCGNVHYWVNGGTRD